MIYLGNKYIPPTNEILWFFAGVVVGMVLMAVIDFVIDRSKKNGK